MNPQLKFLRLSGSSSEKDLELIDKGIKLAESNQIDVIIINDTNEVKELISDSAHIDQTIYVYCPFEGKIFNKLKEKGYRLIGPQCVISCLLLEIPVPKQIHPVYNVAMLKTVVCCSSMKKNERLQIQQLVTSMGGEVTGDFTMSVTHLVAKEVGSKKYEVACANKIPTVFPSWIHSAWENSKYDHCVATDDNVIKEHLIPIFQGCTICVTGIDATKRDAIKTIVTKNGGVYSGELNMKTCTHLLVEHPRGQKYAHAQQWKLHCVSPTWLYECLKKKHWIDEKLYKVEPDSNTTMNNSILQQSNIQNTILGASFRMPPAEIAAKNKGNEKTSKKIIPDKTEKTKSLNIKVISPYMIDTKGITIGESSSYLEECKIFICVRPGPIYDTCKKIINNGGGIRLNTLSDSITHIVIWDQIQPDLSKFLKGIKENNGMFPHVLSPMWLIDSCKKGNSVPEEGYSLIEAQENDENTSEDDVFVKPKLPVTKPAANSLQLQLEDDIEDENTLLNQYMDANHESTRISQFGNETKEAPNLDEVTQDDDITATLEACTSIMEGNKFMISRCESGQVSQFKSFVEEYGGVIVDNVDDCDYIIVPLTYNNEDMSVSPKEVTICWVEKCIENQSLLDPASSFFYKPFFLPDSAKPLKNCVVTVSQYPGVEREHIFHLAELLGATGQDYFARNDTSKVKGSTHLVLEKAEGSKYEASVKWNIPCVRKEWLIRCAQTRRRMPEENFSLFSEEEDEKEEIVMSIEETNAHAWEKEPEVPVVNNDKSVVAAPPCDLTDDISFDFSNRGASIMGDDPTLKVKSKTEDVPTPLRTEVCEGRSAEPDHNNSVSVLCNDDNIQTNEETKDKITMPSFPSTDFSAFNTFIANEKREALGDEATSEVDEETFTTILPASLPGNLNKSRLSIDKSRLSFDFTDALDGFQSPVLSSQGSRRRGSIRRSRVSLPFDVLFTDALQKAVDKHCIADEEVFNNVSDTDTKDEKQTPGILQDVVVVVSKKLSHSQTELHNLTTILGGDIRFMYDKSCSHFIHQGKVSDILKDYAEAKKDKKYLVSPHWLQACVDANARVDEAQYPVTYNPRMSIEVTSDRPTRSKAQGKGNSSSNGSSTDDTDNDVKSNTEKKSTKDLSPKEKVKEKETVDVQKKMEEIMNAGKAPKNDRRTRRQTNNTSANKSDHCHRKMRGRTSSQKNDSSSSDPKVIKTSVVECINEQSQGGFITYDDPTGRLERERILEHLKRASPSQDIESLYYPVEKLASSVNDTDNSKNKENQDLNETVITIEGGGSTHNTESGNAPKQSLSPPKPQISLPITNASAKPDVINLLYDKEADDELKKIENAKKYKFLFSGINGQEKIDYGATIEELGGVLFDVQYFNMQATHLVVKAPSKNEKYLAALASGRWACHMSYLDASREASDFVDESDHEWGSQPSSTEIASAARRWRIELAQKRQSDPTAGAFVGWVVLLCIETSKQVGFKRILEAGGAKLLAVRPPFDNIQGATHAFIGDRKLLVKGNVDLRTLHTAGIWILKPEYIADYLIINPKPPVFDYVLDEVNSFDEKEDSAPSQRKRKALDAPNAKQKRSRR